MTGSKGNLPDRKTAAGDFKETISPSIKASAVIQNGRSFLESSDITARLIDPNLSVAFCTHAGRWCEYRIVG